MIKWIKSRWNDPVWSKVFANAIWFIPTAAISLIVTIIKAWQRIVDFMSTRHSVSNFLVVIIVFSLVVIAINKPLFIRLYNRIKHRFRDHEEFTFTKQINDDHYYPIPILTPRTTHKLIVTPLNTLYWRFGLTLSQDGIIDRAQRQKNQPLFHLTKNLNTNILVATEYDTNFQLITNDQQIIENYTDQPVTLIIDYDVKTTSSIIKVFDVNKRELISRSYKGYQYVILSCWGDGNEFEILMIRDSSFNTTWK